jgi:hypothetical protein
VADFDGKEYDATYRWQSDPDNYPRFTGFAYLAGTKSPGAGSAFSNPPMTATFSEREKMVLDVRTEFSM